MSTADSDRARRASFKMRQVPLLRREKMALGNSDVGGRLMRRLILAGVSLAVFFAPRTLWPSLPGWAGFVLAASAGTSAYLWFEVACMRRQLNALRALIVASADAAD